MVEVFRTNVIDEDQARMLLERIRMDFTDYKVNFDLDDCDKILRVESKTRSVEISMLINLLISCGIDVEVLDDEVPVDSSRQNHLKASLSGTL